nr:DUF488 family protein [Corallococcus exiguus]
MSTKASKAALRIVASAQQLPQQLDLFSESSPSSRIISLGFDGVDFGSFERLIKNEHIKTIVDVRLSPSFIGRGFSLDNFSSLIQHHSIGYEHMPALANKYIGEHWDAGIILNRYAEHVWTNRELLVQLKHKAAEGPLLLLGRTPHVGLSGRSILIDALVELGLIFSLRSIERTEDLSSQVLGERLEN